MASQYVKIEGMVTSVVKYSDKNNILSVYTPGMGRLSFLSSTSGTRIGKMRNARLLPLSLIEAEIKPDRNKEMQMLRAFTLSRPWNGIYSTPVKTIMAGFIAEFLNRLLRDSPPDTLLWDRIVGGIERFNTLEDNVADFHIHFLASLLGNVGIAPDVSGYAPGKTFDMRGGIYADTHPLHSDVLTGEDLMIPLVFADATESDEIFPWHNRERRNHALDILLRYYAIHYPGLDKLRSVEVLRQLF